MSAIDRDAALDAIEARYVDEPETMERDAFREALNDAYNAGLATSEEQRVKLYDRLCKSHAREASLRDELAGVTQLPQEYWGVWCEQDGEPGFWRSPDRTSDLRPLRTTRAEAERRAENLNRDQAERRDSVGWSYSARRQLSNSPDPQAEPERVIPVAANNPTTLGDVWVGEAIPRPPVITMTVEQYAALTHPPHTCAVDNDCAACRAMLARWSQTEQSTELKPAVDPLHLLDVIGRGIVGQDSDGPIAHARKALSELERRLK